MADRRTRVTINVPWDDQVHDHPAQWRYSQLLNTAEEVYVVSFDDVEPELNEPQKTVGFLSSIVSARLPDTLMDRVETEAKRRGTTQAAVVRAIIAGYFDDRP